MRKERRAGFTLVELLVVIAIIAILASLAAWGVFAMIGTGQKRNTEATIRTLKKLLDDRYKDVIADAAKEEPSNAAMAMANGDLARARVIWKKVRLMEAFPQRYSDVQTPTVLNNLILPDRKYKPHFAKYAKELQGKPGGGAGESSACLLLSLKTLGSDGMVAIQDQLNYAVGDTDGDGVPEFIDNFGKPLVFTRFAQGGNVQAANPASPGSSAFKKADPIDNDGLLISPNWYPSNNRKNVFDVYIHPVSPDNGATAYYTIPVIASAGKDGAVGTADDIFSFKLTGD
jgi:prepilin-type N-terminal cleavage/methylation domain-containing protein